MAHVASLGARLSALVGERTRRVVISGAAGAAQRTASIVATFLIYPRILHALGAGGFGIWAAAASLASLLYIADFGIGSAVVTLVSDAMARDRPEEARRYLSVAFVLAGGISLLVLLGGAAAAHWLAPPAARTSYLVAAVGLAVNIPLGLANSAWSALQRMWMWALNDFVQTLLLLGGLFGAILLGAPGTMFVVVVYAAWLAANTITTVLLFRQRPDLRPDFRRLGSSAIRQVFRTGLRYFLLSGLDALSYALDTVIALQILGAAAAAQMAVAQRVVVAAVGLLVVMAQPLWPAFVEAAARRDGAWIRTAVVRGAALMGAVGACGAAMLVLAGPLLLRLWLGSSVVVGSGLLWAMALWIVCMALMRTPAILLNALGITDFQILVFGASAGLALTLKIVLGPIYGPAAILCATAVTVPLIVLPASAWRVNRWFAQNALPPEASSAHAAAALQEEAP